IPGSKRRRKRSLFEEEEECDWIVVNKRKITILIPPLPSGKESGLQNVVEQEQPPTSRQPEENETGSAFFTMKKPRRRRVCVDGGASLDARMRASLVEKKVEMAGGMEKWLVSMGLTCFVKALERRKLNKFELARLDVKKVKEMMMGNVAVGPRRKLIHAIGCLSQPPCF
ncbi:hypothetical protein M569_06654, partial [Genlisea aurea]